MKTKRVRTYREIAAYIFFGICTVAVNALCYALFYEQWHIKNVTSTLLAWLAAVIFAFFTNKFFVFKSKKKDRKNTLEEAGSFFACRIATGVLDVLLMFVTVDLLAGNGLLWKLVSNVIVTLLNYFASKLFIFRKQEDNKSKEK